MPLDRVTRLEATNNGKTRSRGLGTVTARSSSTSGRADRFFRDIHGTESVWHPNIVAAGAATETGIRPATTTFFGDTGLWFVPTAEVLPHGKWSVSGYRRGTNYIQGFTNVGDFAGTFGVGIRDRAEIFGSFLFDTRIDRDLRPLFSDNDGQRRHSSIAIRASNRGWTGDNVGDFYLGAKFNFWSEYRQQPAAIALRGMFKVPTGDDESGASTGNADFFVDFVFSKEYAARGIEVAGYAGYEFRGSPDDFEIPGGAFRWGWRGRRRRAARCAAPSSSTARCRPGIRPSPAAPWSASTDRSHR